jgi:hypothetical protein
VGSKEKKREEKKIGERRRGLSPPKRGSFAFTTYAVNTSPPWQMAN